jgi:LPXTG-motif cell wall-anchored protein
MITDALTADGEGRRSGTLRIQSWGLLAIILVAVGLGAVPMMASASSTSGCPVGTYQSWSESYEPPTNTIWISNFPITYVWVDTSLGRSLFGDGTPMNNSTIDVLSQVGAPASAAGFCKNSPVSTTTVPESTTTVPETTTTVPETTTTVPETTTTVPETTTTVPETTTTVPETTTTVPETTTTVPETTTTVPETTTTVPETTTTVPETTTTVPETTTTVPETTTTVPETTTTVPESTTTSVAVEVLPPISPSPEVLPPAVPGVQPPTVGPPVTQLPETGGDAPVNTLLMGLAAIAGGLLLIKASRRAA